MTTIEINNNIIYEYTDSGVRVIGKAKLIEGIILNGRLK